MDALEVTGKTREQIAELLKETRRDRIYDLIYQLATDEPQFSTATVARNREVDPRTVLRWIERGLLKAQAISTKEYRIKLSALRDFDERTEVKQLAA